jgi:enamine deaminase RidA (YjgF/YER057c/UK114 family)
MPNSAAALAEAYGFSQSVRAGGLVFFSGQVGMEPSGSVPEDPEAQYRLAFAALRGALAAEGLTPAHLVELLTFHTSFPGHMDVFMKVKADFLNGTRPTWTAIGVAALATPGTLVEIKATARA